MLLQFPRSLHYPITITALLKTPGDEVQKFTPLVQYKYLTFVMEDDDMTREPVRVEKWFPAMWESPITGTLKRWMIEVGSVVESGNFDLVEIEEPCSHEVQFGGLCAACGLDMTLQDYTSFSNKARAEVNMAHDTLELTISQDEAARLENEAKRRLLRSKKLSLVVDLDQTIIHATVDPTVGEWKDDPSNPNHDSVKDVQAFQLNDDMAGGRGCWYYVKLRPGLHEFLERISQLYELHIYTMGTRAYALNVAKIVDPEGKIFGNRVLSRDESGSMTEKDLHRLFPVDTKMVVIIDDRGDVWKWSDNLIKVRPYDFFVGIGDINSSFLPKRQDFPSVPTGATMTVIDATLDKTETPPAATKDEMEDADGEEMTGVLPEGGGDTSTAADLTTLEQLVKMGAGDDMMLLEEQAHQLTESIKVQQESRPLAKQQQALDAKDDAEAVVGNGKEEILSEHGKHRHHLLHDDDVELIALERNLTEVHRHFFETWEQEKQIRGDRVSQLRGGRPHKRRRQPEDDDLSSVPDIKILMPSLKHRALSGVVLVFSGVIPLGTNVQNSDIAVWAKSFGAVVEETLTGRVTHVIAARSRTAKVRQAARYPHVQIVNPQWLYDSISNWAQQGVTPYLIAIHPEDRNPLNGVPGGPDGLFLEEATNIQIPMSSEEDESDDMGIDDDDDDEDDDDINLSGGESPESSIMRDEIRIDWDDVDQELNEFLADTSDEGSDYDSGGGGGADGGDLTDRDSDVESVVSKASSKRIKRIPQKRSRPSTPSSSGGGTGGVESGDNTGSEDESLWANHHYYYQSSNNNNSSSSNYLSTPESRLAKRQKLARERHSGLRTVVTPKEIDSSNSLTSPTPPPFQHQEQDSNHLQISTLNNTNKNNNNNNDNSTTDTNPLPSPAVSTASIASAISTTSTTNTTTTTDLLIGRPASSLILSNVPPANMLGAINKAGQGESDADDGDEDDDASYGSIDEEDFLAALQD